MLFPILGNIALLVATVGLFITTTRLNRSTLK
jgi:hypothetical protein